MVFWKKSWLWLLGQIMVEIGHTIQKGADTFLMSEYKFCIIWCLMQAVVILVAVDYAEDKVWKMYSTVSFLVGAFTSIISGYIAMAIATKSNYRTTFIAYDAYHSCEGDAAEKRKYALSRAFKVAYHAGCAMGFVLVSIALLVFTILLIVYFKVRCDGDVTNNISELMEGIAGYGLGGSTVALFGRVGGGIYTKAADVGADLCGKLEN